MHPNCGRIIHQTKCGRIIYQKENGRIVNGIMDQIENVRPFGAHVLAFLYLLNLCLHLCDGTFGFINQLAVFLVDRVGSLAV